MRNGLVSTILPGSSLYFICWYWTVGFPSERGGYTYLMLSVMFPLWYTSFAQSVAAMSPDAPIGALLFSFLFSFVINLQVFPSFVISGKLILVPQYWRSSAFRWAWLVAMDVPPLSLQLSGRRPSWPRSVFLCLCVSTKFCVACSYYPTIAIGGYDITCADVEYVTVSPPSGQTCGRYLDPFISVAGGYIMDSNATDVCTYCASRTTDQFLEGSFNIVYSQHWRNFGIFWAYIFFNVSHTNLCYLYCD